MIVTGLIKTSMPNILSPALIKGKVLYYYDFSNNVMVASSDSSASFMSFRFVEEKYAMCWWHKNMEIASSWSKLSIKERKETKPEYDKESLKQIPSEIVMDWMKPEPDLRR